MTAFSRAVVETSSARLTMEIQSLNRRALEISTILPPEFTRFDNEIRGWIKEDVCRGYLVVRMTVFFEGSSSGQLKPDLSLAQNLYEGRRLIANHLAIAEESSPLDWICSQVGVFECLKEERLDEKEALSALKELTQTAVSDLVTIKNIEGAAIEKDITQRIELLSSRINEVEAKAKDSVEGYKEKLKKTLEGYLSGGIDNDDRILKEICIYADKIDISEEITRFRSHIDQFNSFLKKNENSKGKSLDFVLQELSREVNTIGSKSPNIEISKLVVEMKNELEKIREQTFNVE